MTDEAADVVEVDGGDRACGELLLVFAMRARQLPAGTHLRLIATDPAAAIDLPAWCYLTGHHFLSATSTPSGLPCYEIRLDAQAGQTIPGQPWQLHPDQQHTQQTRT